MHSLQKQFHDFIRDNRLVERKEKVLLGISGGMDSMVLAHLFLESEIPFAMAHCNFGLRGEESDGDKQFVLDWAEKHQVKIYVQRFTLGSGSIQLNARQARYEWFHSLAKDYNLAKVALAHHLNDSLETVLLNLARGTGVQGFKGISIKNGILIRPLLFAARNQLEQYAAEKGIEWREDSSNVKLDYKRNRIRHKVVPQLELLNPSLHQTFRLTSERIRLADEMIQNQCDEVISRYLREGDESFTLRTDWISKPSDLLILAKVLERFDFNYQTSKEIFQCLHKSGKFFPSNNWLASVDRGCLIFVKNRERQLVEVTIPCVGQYLVGSAVFTIEIVESHEIDFTLDEVEFFDSEKLLFPLKIRNWKEGDRFKPLGMRGEKKVSDFLIDQKVPLPKKKDVLILKDQNEIAWVIDHRISNTFMVQDRNSQALRISIDSSFA
ncbi:MAG: tRNA lysidine(34) synthetase TilS [Ekhidna sp.]|nr:tRNA lysidine(34) synthetase TilS [Ekhidna sp.]